MKKPMGQSIRIRDIILFIILGWLALLFIVSFLFPFSYFVAVIAVIVGLIKYRPSRDWLFSVDRSIRIGDIILFVVLGFLAFFFVVIFLFPSPPSSEVGVINESMLIIFLSPIAAGAVIIGLIKYRLWRNWFFWILLVIIWFAIFLRSQNTFTFTGGDARSSRIVATLLSILVVVPLWQLVMALSLVARSLGVRRSTS